MFRTVITCYRMPINRSTAVTAPFKPPCRTDTIVKGADMERILERLDRIINDVGPLMEVIAEKLGVDINGEFVGNRIGSFPMDSQFTDGNDTEELTDSESEEEASPKQ